MDPEFGVTYFDGTRDTGYGGYQYDGRWKPISETIVRHYGLNSKSRALDVGCAKGFFVADLMQICPGITVHGIDVSQYAVSNALESAKPFVSLTSADSLGCYPDHSFDFVSAMNTLHFLTPGKAEKALREIMRIGKNGRYFVQVDAYTNEVERERLLAWAPIIKTVYSVDQWLELFKKTGYDGDYYWTFVRPASGVLKDS
jgi:ubiquinone/menaquinone biosynthesis C-methylase UbiE